MYLPSVCSIPSLVSLDGIARLIAGWRRRQRRRLRSRTRAEPSSTLASMSSKLGLSGWYGISCSRREPFCLPTRIRQAGENQGSGIERALFVYGANLRASVRGSALNGHVRWQAVTLAVCPCSLAVSLSADPLVAKVARSLRLISQRWRLKPRRLWPNFCPAHGDFIPPLAWVPSVAFGVPSPDKEKRHSAPVTVET